MEAAAAVAAAAVVAEAAAHHALDFLQLAQLAIGKVTQSGKLCVVSASKLNLWRADSELTIQLTVKGGGVEQTIEFPAGKDTVPWPASLPVSTGAEYQLSEAESGDLARVTFISVSNPPSDAVETAQTLIANGCENQLDVLVEASPSID